MSSKNNTASFIQLLNTAHSQHKDRPIDERFIEISKQVSIYPYLTQYIGTDDLPANSFIGMNVRTTGIIPFFTYKTIHGNEAGKKVREKILKGLKKITTEAESENGFYSYPQFLEEFKLEYFDLIISRESSGDFNITIISAKDFSQNDVSKDKILKHIKTLPYTASFINSWYYSVIREDEYLNTDVRVVVKVSDPNLQGVGNSFYVIITPYPGAKDEKSPLELSNRYCIPLLDVMAIIKTLYINDVNELVKKEAIKSAISAIMSRNMSHNLGSHYLYYTKSSLEELAETSGHAGPKIRGAAKVLSYIQGRMDYLATIVSNDKYPYGSVNFKSQIWDELTVDDFSKRHYGNDPDSDFIKNLAENKNQLIATRQLTEELLNLYDNLSDSSKESISSNRTFIEEKIGALTFQISRLDKKSAYGRTANYLLTNLIRSENYTRPDVLDGDIPNTYRPLFLVAQVWNEQTGKYELFTGSNEKTVMEREESVKEKLSKINLALPGGTMSCHAFYNILENFIRNSAKYSWTDARMRELKITIALKINKDNQTVEILLFDDKHDALKPRDSKHSRPLLIDIKSRLRKTHILGENNTVDKDNKGLKEMLFSAVWLKANESSGTFTDIISKIENAPGKNKLKLISKYAFEFIGIDDTCAISDNPQNANLGIRFNLPLFSRVESLQGKSIHDLIRLHTDVIEIADKDKNVLVAGRKYSDVFTRTFTGKLPAEHEMLKQMPNVQGKYDEDAISAYKLTESVKSTFPDMDEYKLRFASVREPGWNSPQTQNQLLFDTHFSTQASKATLQSYYGRYSYVDTISGNNFTKTLQGLFSAGINRRLKGYKSFNDYYLTVKIKESCLTRITIIDERLFNSVRWDVNLENIIRDTSIDNTQIIDIRSSAAELSMKNIRVLNFIDKAKKLKKSNKSFERSVGLPFLYGNKFLETGPCSKTPEATHFLSIHLGLVEKLLKAKELEDKIGVRGDNAYSTERIDKLMNMLREHFGKGIPNGVHISIHSGRGNFSKELEGPLKEYPFISLAALENAFNNSKYLLAQLFYNTIFVGKGEVNH